MVVLELHGVDEVVMQKAADGWAAIQEDRGVAFDAAEVHPGVLRLSAAHAVGCERIPAEMAPSGHTLPGPETPLPRESRIGQDDPALLDDWGIGRQLQETDEGALEQEGGLGCTYGDGVALPMDTGAGDLFGKQTRNHALGGLMLPPRGNQAGITKCQVKRVPSLLAGPAIDQHHRLGGKPFQRSRGSLESSGLYLDILIEQHLVYPDKIAAEACHFDIIPHISKWGRFHFKGLYDAVVVV